MIISSFRLFARQIGWRLGILMMILLAAGLAEGIGVSMILPLLQEDIAKSDETLSRMITSLFSLLDLNPSGQNILTLLVVFFFIRAVFLIGQTWYQAVLLSGHLTFMRAGMIKSILRANYRHVTSYDAGYLTNAIVREIQAVNAGMRNLMDLMVAVVMGSVYLILPILLQPILTLYLVALAIPIAILTGFLIRKTRRLSINYTEVHGRQESFLIEGIRNAKFVKATGRVPIVQERMTDETRRVSIIFKKLFILSGISRFAPEPLVVFVMAAIILIYTRGFNEPIGEILFLMFLFFQSSKNILRVQSTFRQFIEATGSLHLYHRLRADLDAHAVPDDSYLADPNLTGDIELKNVTVTYDSKNRPALDGIDLTIPNRATVALVGASGSGKTTIANLVCGLIAPSAGTISLDGVNYGDFSVTKLQQRLGYVTQESAVFNGSIEENITFWDSDPDTARVDNILNQLELRGIGSGETGGVTSGRTIGGDGATLSGGERQRLGIARELYRDPELMILDEATSALDSELERKFDEILESQRNQKTFLLIAHRLATVRNADLIYVLDEGRVIESGSFEELNSAGGEFARMVKLQSF
jgi:ABC-type multidrug transport system fused ATPase/permease subunit